MRRKRARVPGYFENPEEGYIARSIRRDRARGTVGEAVPGFSTIAEAFDAPPSRSIIRGFETPPASGAPGWVEEQPGHMRRELPPASAAAIANPHLPQFDPGPRRGRSRNQDTQMLANGRMAFRSEDDMHRAAIQRLLDEQRRGHDPVLMSDIRASVMVDRPILRGQVSRANRQLSRLNIREHLDRRSVSRLPAGYALNVPVVIPTKAPNERHLRMFATDYISLYNTMAAELRNGASTVNALLPYSYAESGRVMRSPLRAYTSLVDLRQNFWWDIRARIRFLHTGFRGDNEHNTNAAPMDINAGVSFLDHPAGIEVYSSSRVRAGACNKHVESHPILRGVFSEYRTLNPKTSGNNCGLACLRAANANLPSIKEIKKKAGLPSTTTMLSDQELIRVGELYGMKVKVFTYNSREEDLFDALTSDDGYTCLFLDNNHYKLVLTRSSFYTCPICKRKLRSKDTDALMPHECSMQRVANLTSHPNAQVRRWDGAYDIETRNDLSSLTEYDIGLLENHDDPSARVFVMDQVPTLICLVYDSDEGLCKESFFGMTCLTDFLDRLVQLHEKYIYLDLVAHNGSRFDAMLVLKAIKTHPVYYKYTIMDDVITKGTRILNFKFLNHTFKGTENFLEGSLAKLCSSFKIKDSKIKTITIQGKEWNTMDICLMNPRMNPQEFVAALNHPDSHEFKDAYITYCMFDCISLMQVWQLFKKTMLDKVVPVAKYPFLSNVFERACTLPGLAMKMFKAIHSKEVSTGKIDETTNKEKRFRIKTYWTPAPDDKQVAKLIQDAKLGGISHVAKPGLHIGEISLVDVKSLYPSVMLGNDYPEGEPIILTGDKECRDFINIPETMAIIRCTRATMTSECIADYPARTENGLDWSAKSLTGAALTCLDIRRILRKGGTVEMEWGVGWTKKWNPFIKVIKQATEIKIEQDSFKASNDPQFNPALREAAKLTGNALFGKMLEAAQNKAWIEFTNFTDYSEYDPEGKYDVCQSNGHFYIKVPEEQKVLPPIQFGVFILAHSREVMQRYFDIVGRQNVIASETDSIHCHSKHLLSLKQSNDPMYRIGEKYGNMVVEYDGSIKKAMFLAKKCYAYLEMKEGYKDEDKKRRCKGVASSCLTDDFYWTLFNQKEVKVDNMRVFRRNLFSDVHTGITIEYISKVIKAPNGGAEYKTWTEDGPLVIE